MKQKIKTILLTMAFLVIFLLLLILPKLCLEYAQKALLLWFNIMIPTLLPFMILSGILIKMNLADKIVKPIAFCLNPIYKITQNAYYAMIIGFLCGFPMGAFSISKLYKSQKISKNEAQFLLCFCNNIGPVFFCSQVIPIQNRFNPLQAIGLMYGIPLAYSIFIRYTFYIKKLSTSLVETRENKNSKGLLLALDESTEESLNGITKLGGYMVFFGMLLVIPTILIHNKLLKNCIICLVEITNGVAIMGEQSPELLYIFLSFGGFSCIAQTYSMIHKTDLSISKYIFHKIIQALITMIILVTILFPGSYFL